MLTLVELEFDHRMFTSLPRYKVSSTMGSSTVKECAMTRSREAIKEMRTFLGMNMLA